MQSDGAPGLKLPRPHVAVVIGGGGAIGCACVRAFAGAGATVWSLDARREAAASSLEGLDGSHRHETVDVRDVDGMTKLAADIGAVDSVVYTVGINYDGHVVDTDWEAYRRVMGVNLDGAFHAGAAFAKSMVEGGRQGAFVFLSSAAGLRGEAGASVYCATKFGLIGFVESFAAELTPHGIRANAICPGNVDSPMLKEVAQEIAARVGEEPDEIYRSMATTGAARRLVAPREVAQLCLFLASPAASAITGSALRIDAGAMLMV